MKINRNLNPNWQMHLASGLMRSEWCVDVATLLAQQHFVNAILTRGTYPQFSSVSNQIALNCVEDNYTDQDSNMSNESAAKCGIVNISGTMMRYGGDCSYGASDWCAMLDYYRDDPDVKCVVLDINSGGGDAYSVSPIIDSIRKIKAAGKGVYACIEYGCSAAYIIASACDEIFMAYPIFAKVGSIGMFCTLYNDEKMLEQDGLVRIEIYAPESPDKNLEFREALKGNFDLIISEHISPMAQSMISLVQANRPQLPDEVFTGRTYFSDEAISLGLVDGVKTLDETVRYALDYHILKQFSKQ